MLFSFSYIKYNYIIYIYRTIEVNYNNKIINLVINIPPSNLFISLFLVYYIWNLNFIHYLILILIMTEFQASNLKSKVEDIEKVL